MKSFHKLLSLVLVLLLLISVSVPAVSANIDVCSDEYKQITAASREKIVDACKAGSNHVLSQINSVGYDYNPSTGRLKLYKCQNLKYDLLKNMFPENNRVTYSCNILTNGFTEKHLLDILDYITTANELDTMITRSIKDTSFTIGLILAIAIGSIKADAIELNAVDGTGMVKYQQDHDDDLKHISELYSKANTLYNSIAKTHYVICEKGLKIGAL